MGVHGSNMERIGRTAAQAIVALALALLILPVQPMAFAQEGDDGIEQMLADAEYVEDEILVVMEEDVGVQEGARSFSAFALDDDEALEQAEEAVEEDAPVVVKLDEGTTVKEALEQAESDPNIKHAQPNYIYHLMDTVATGTQTSGDAAPAGDAANARFVPDDPAVANTAPSRPDADAWHLDSINAFEAWDMVTCDDEVTVAVLDTGCRLDHEDLKDQIWQEYAWNSYLNGKLTKDYAGHGTHVCGLAAAQANNGIGIAGSSYNARILPVCVFDTSGEGAMTSTLVNAYRYILDLNEKDPNLNLHVVNMSLGGYGSTGKDDEMLMEQIVLAKEQDIVTICAGGNGDKYGNPYTVNSWPSDYEDCVAVTALDTNNTSPSTWCDYNTAKDICAPGVDLYSTYYLNSTSYTFMSGTSMASPITAGAFALLWKAVPDLTVDEALEAVYGTAGELQVPAGREGRYGAGKLDIAAALKSLTGVYITMKDPVVKSGTDLQMEYTLAGDMPAGTALQWSVADRTGSATIDARTGVLTAIIPGTVEVTVTCSAGGSEIGSDSCIVTIEPLSLDGSPVARTARSGVRIAWTATEGAAGYRVERASSADGLYEEVADTQDTVFDDASLEDGEEAFYRVAPYSLATHKTQTGVFSQSVRGLALPVVSALEPDGARAYSQIVDFLDANGSQVDAIVLADADDPLMMLEAISVAGVADGIVVPVDADDDWMLSGSAASSLAATGATEVVVLGGPSAVPVEHAEAMAEAAGAESVRYGTDDSSANDIASELIAAYSDAWADDVLLVEPGMAQRASDIASYAFVAHSPVMFTAEGGASIPGAALVAAKRFEEVVVFGGTDAVSRNVDIVLSRQGVSTSRWVPDDGTAVEAAGRCVDGGSLSWDFTAYFQRDDYASAAMMASVMGQVRGVALPLGSGQDETGTLAATMEHGDQVSCAFIAGEAAVSEAMAPTLKATITHERIAAELEVEVEELYTLTGTTTSSELAYSGDGELHVSSSDPGVATVEYDALAGRISITGESAGNAVVTVSADAGTVTDAPAPVEIKVAVIGVDFLGASLRNDGGTQADGSSTAMRFGYSIEFPGSGIDEDSVEWKWNYGLVPEELEHSRAGENYLQAADGVISNLVFTGIGSAAYGTTLYSQLELTFLTADGFECVLKDDVRQRSVEEVCKAIIASSQSSDADRAYAQALLQH